jgi:hypothetical protein
MGLCLTAFRPGIRCAMKGIRRAGTHAAAAIVLVAALASCAGGSRSGSDQPGVPGLVTTTAQPAHKESVNRSSEADVAAALRRADVSDPEGVAKLLISDRPYPVGQPGLDRIRQVLTDHNTDPDDVNKVLDSVEP